MTTWEALVEQISVVVAALFGLLAMVAVCIVTLCLVLAAIILPILPWAALGAALLWFAKWIGVFA